MKRWRVSGIIPWSCEVEADTAEEAREVALGMAENDGAAEDSEDVVVEPLDE